MGHGHGSVVSSKSMKLIPGLLNCKAKFVGSPRKDGEGPPVQISLPDGGTAGDLDGLWVPQMRLSERLKRRTISPPGGKAREERVSQNGL
jgi:hypothetical protein